MDSPTVGVLGGGQLGRMLVEAANRLNIKVTILDQGLHGPAKQLSNHDDHIDGKFTDSTAIRELAARCDVLTIEIEHVDVTALKEFDAAVRVEPSWRTIETIQDKFLQKEYLLDHDVPVARSVAVRGIGEDDLREMGDRLGYPFMLKSRKEAYDGRGNYPVKSEQEIPNALDALGKRALYAEKWANFKMELAVMVVKTKDRTLAFPTVETIHEDSICKLVYAPPRNVSPDVASRAQELAKKAIGAFEGRGVFGVEMFLLEDGTLLVNEIAPRPHNSGHYTIEACYMSQYEAHLRAILEWPIPEESLALKTPAVMLNILGGAGKDSHLDVAKRALQVPGCQIHLYGKGEARPGRKMGHVTVTAATMKQAETLIAPMIETVDKVRAERGLPSASSPADQLNNAAQTSLSSASVASPANPLTSSLTSPNPVVGIIMGSDSDLPRLRPAIDTLAHFSIPFEVSIRSAHRTHAAMTAYATTASSRGILVIIAAAGGAAHLPGMTASATPLPVIGVPIKRSILDGVDSLYSINEMPRGVPVATVGIDNAVNAALLAVRILGVREKRYLEMMEDYMRMAAQEVREKDRELQTIGPEAYLEKMGRK